MMVSDKKTEVNRHEAVDYSYVYTPPKKTTEPSPAPPIKEEGDEAYIVPKGASMDTDGLDELDEDFPMFDMLYTELSLKDLEFLLPEDTIDNLVGDIVEQVRDMYPDLGDEADFTSVGEVDQAITTAVDMVLDLYTKEELAVLTRDYLISRAWDSV